jgi:hypothetical protein
MGKYQLKKLLFNKMIRSTLNFFSLVFLITSLTGCYYDRYDELHPVISSASGCDTTKTMSFSTDIVPILNTNCGTNNSCHSSANTSGIDLSAYSGVNDVALDGRLVSSVVWDGNASQMPQGSSTQISVCDQTKIKKWVNAGALNN